MPRRRSFAPFALVLCALALMIGLMPYSGVVYPLPWFKATQGGLFLIGLVVTGLITLVQFRVGERAADAALAATYLFCAPLLVANLTFFPGTLPFGSQAVVSRATVWFYIVQLGAFGLGGLAYSFVRGARLPRRYADWIGPTAVSASVLLSLLVFLATSRWDATDVYTNRPIVAVVGPLMALVYAAAILRLARLRSRTSIENWFLAALALSMLGTIDIQLNITRYSVPWYYSSVLFVVGSWCVLGYIVKAGYERYEHAVTSVAELSEEATAEQERFAETVNCAAIGIAHLTASGNLRFANDWVHSRPPHLIAELLEQSREARGKIERRITNEDGSDSWYELNISEVSEESAGDRVLVINDISASKRAEAAMAHMNEIKSQFIATMSHEIRTPLNGIVGISELFRRTSPLTEKQRRFAETIDASAQSLLALVNDILDFSKIEAAKLEMERSSFDLMQLAGEVAFAHEAEARRKNLRLDLRLRGDLAGSFYGDPLRLRQVLGNLLANAIRSTESGYVTLSLEALENAGPNARIGFTVEDSGGRAGREEQIEPFAPAGRAEGLTGWAVRGAGLGLTIAKRLVELMGGTIELSPASEAGVRLSFAIWLERESAANGTLAPAPAIEPGRERRGPSGRILIAEDNEVNRLLVLAQLEELGFTADWVENGRAAVEAARSNAYAMIFMDTQMPGLDGLEATAAIRTAEAALGRRTPIVAMTANPSPEHRQRCLDAGMDDHLAKPLLLSAIESVLRRWLEEPPL